MSEGQKDSGHVWFYVPKIRRIIQAVNRDGWQDTCCHLFSEVQGYFRRTMHGFTDSESVGLTGLPAVQICLLLKMYGASIRQQ